MESVPFAKSPPQRRTRRPGTIGTALVSGPRPLPGSSPREMPTVEMRAVGRFASR